MLSKIFKNKNKNKKKTLSEPIISVYQNLSENKKPIIYYSVDKQEYVTVYVPDHMNLYTKTLMQDKTLHKKIKTLSCNVESSCKDTENDRLNDIYEYYINNSANNTNYNDIDINYNNLNTKNDNLFEKNCKYDENNTFSIYSNI